jgi:hypothetical protein
VSGSRAGEGALGSVALGVALIPPGSLTSASNLAFAFVAFTIVVAGSAGAPPPSRRRSLLDSGCSTTRGRSKEVS